MRHILQLCRSCVRQLRLHRYESIYLRIHMRLIFRVYTPEQSRPAAYATLSSPSRNRKSGGAQPFLFCSLATAIVVGDFMTTIFFFKWSVRNRFLHFLLDSNDDDDSATIRYTSVFVYCEKKKRNVYSSRTTSVCHFLLSRTLNLV